ncbi:flagellar biosynthesis anti-sigma factor FlgM [Methylocaldum szegediense]|uniref:Negative regulator of flagellin synthesis FlgM n=1 Tax=Methylocaldum szegediense TaxID=73780 RepID=A0ABM9I0Q6_9GAMM|nr:flagellar biosynthesis anti-sigma factor FlgM [Methylocaldum szegediense]CAI8804477.1 negative regulator of flagellin synthesis FlgM [Methylocaldum szegediense]
MEIKLQNTVGSLSAGGLQKKQSREPVAGGSLSTPIGGVSSQTSLLLSEIKQRLLSEPSIDEAKVARIAGLVQSGSYQIDPQRAAEKLIAMELMLPEFS